MYYNKGTNKVAYTFPPYHIGNPLGTRVSGGLSFLFVTSNLTAARKYGGSVAPLHHSMCTGSVRPARTRRRRVPRMRGSPLGTRVSGGLSFFNNKATMKRFFDCAQNDNTVTVKKDPPFVWGIFLLFGALSLSFDQSGIGARLQIDALDKQEQQRIEYRGRSALEEVAVHKADQDHR